MRATCPNCLASAMEISQLSAVVQAIGETFERRMTFPPGVNLVLPAVDASDLGILERELSRRVPDDVRAFFRTVAEVRWPDLWGGYFLGSAAWSAQVHRDGAPRSVRTGGEDVEIVVLGEGGAGVRYAVPLDEGGPLLVLPPATIHDGVYLADEPDAAGFGAAAENFDAFVNRLTEAALAGEPDPFDPQVAPRT